MEFKHEKDGFNVLIINVYGRILFALRLKCGTQCQVPGTNNIRIATTEISYQPRIMTYQKRVVYHFVTKIIHWLFRTGNNFSELNC